MTGRASLAVALLGLVPWLGCVRMSERVEDPSVGTNGGFEYSRSGLPVNWLVYSPSTIPTGSYDLLFDRTDFKEGKQSLKFLVRDSSARGGRFSPGIAQERPASPGQPYRVSFWIRSDGSSFLARIGGVGAMSGEYESVASSTGATDSWQFVDHVFTMPQRYETIRFELSVLSPGGLWVDDVQIELIEVEDQ